MRRVAGKHLGEANKAYFRMVSLSIVIDFIIIIIIFPYTFRSFPIASFSAFERGAIGMYCYHSLCSLITLGKPTGCKRISLALGFCIIIKSIIVIVI